MRNTLPFLQSRFPLRIFAQLFSINICQYFSSSPQAVSKQTRGCALTSKQKDEAVKLQKRRTQAKLKTDLLVTVFPLWWLPDRAGGYPAYTFVFVCCFICSYCLSPLPLCRLTHLSEVLCSSEMATTVWHLMVVVWPT